MSLAGKALWHFMFGVVGRMLPFSWCRFLAAPVALAAWTFGVRRRITLINLRLAFPSLSESERIQIAKQSFRSICTVFIEVTTLRYIKHATWERWFRFENPELLSSIGPSGALLLSGHVGNWEMLAISAGMHTEKPIAVVVKQQRDYGWLDRVRTSFGNNTIPTNVAARHAVSELSSGGIVAMLADQSAGAEEVTVQLFGIPTTAFSAPARMALRFRPKIIVGFAVREMDGSYSARLSEIHYDDLADTPDAITILTQRYTDRLQQHIVLHPDSWLWTHRKWKNTSGVSYG